MELFLAIGALLIGFILVMMSVPHILSVARTKKLYEPLDARKIHTQTVPPLGGIAIFIGFTISTIVATDGYSFDSLKYIIASVVLMFFIGLKDDLMTISASKKAIVQIFAAVLLITLGNTRFTNMHGVLALYEIGYFGGLFLTLFAMIVIINAFNLIDGIDGLASGLAMLGASTFGIWFYIAGHIPLAIMSFALVGSLAGFFIFNVFGNKNKMFMGDTGSLIIGLIISTLVIKFNELNIVPTFPFAINAAPVVSFAIIIVPLIDTLRVMTIRLFQSKSPFSPDNNHIHHRLLKLVPSHIGVTLIIVFANAVLIGIALLLNRITFNVNYQLLIILLLGIVLSLIPSILLSFIETQGVERVELSRDLR